MASSSSKSLSKSCTKANIGMIKTSGEALFISAASNEKTNPGSLKLPKSFVAKYWRTLPEEIGLRLGNGQLWFGRYVHANESVEGLEYLMRYFKVKPYHFFVFDYNGGPEFGVRIFNEYAVEIDYSPWSRVVTSSDYKANHLALSKKDLFELTDMEKDKLKSIFMYNVNSTFHGDCEVLISNELLEKKENYLVFTEEECKDLKLKQNMLWIEFSFRKFSWKISVIWSDGNVLLGPEWHKFTSEANILAGDVCMFSVTNGDAKYDVAVFEFAEDKKESQNCGAGSAEGHPKWFKEMTKESIAYGQLALPLLFLEKFGDSLHDVLTLFVADGSQFEAYFSNTLNLMFGLKPLIAKYAVKDKYVIFFEYVGHDAFYVSLYNLDGVDIMSEIGEKLMVEKDSEESRQEVIYLSDSNGDENELNKAVESPVDDTLQSFYVVLLKSHVDQNGHGVFFARHMLPIYRKWKRGTLVKLSVGAKSWTVALLRNKKVCRFGLGWNAFTDENKLKVGDKLTFSYVGNCKFSVQVTAV